MLWAQAQILLGSRHDPGFETNDRPHDGRPLKILTVIEEYSRECLAILVARRLRAADVLETLAGLFLTQGVPVHLTCPQ